MQAKSQDPGCPSALLKWVVVPDGFYSTAKKRPPASPDTPPPILPNNGIKFLTYLSVRMPSIFYTLQERRRITIVVIDIIDCY